MNIRTRVVLAVGAAVALAAAGGAVAGRAGAVGGRPASGVTGNASRTALATVIRGSLSSQEQVDATLGYAGQYAVQNRSAGTLTALPAVGQVVSQGQALYQVDGGPVVLLYGQVPAYRSLSPGMTGADVCQLNANLVALGYASGSELSPDSDLFSAQTTSALEEYQDHLGVAASGTLALGQAVFLPTAARITAVSASLGAQTGPGQPVLQATSTARQVSIALDASEQGYVRAGDTVTITLPGGQTTPGTVTSVGTVATVPPANAGTPSTPTVTVDVTPADPGATGTLDQAPVQVSITTATVTNTLIVPVDALLVLAGGGYAVEVTAASGVRRLAPVSLGLFDDAAGTVQVSGAGLRAGQHVVVPAI